MKSVVLAGLALLGLASVASAATVNINVVQYDNRADAVQAQLNYLGSQNVLSYEDWEGFYAFDTWCASAEGVNAGCKSTEKFTGMDGVDTYDNAPFGESIMTTVGSFTALEGFENRGSAREPVDGLVVRSNDDETNNGQPNSGRYDADYNAPGRVDNGNFIDSNDTAGILWNTEGGVASQFQFLSFMITDFDDVGAVAFSMDVFGNMIDPDGVYMNTEKRGNANIFLVTLDFSEIVSDVNIRLSIDPGDGIGVDGMSMGVVPLPPAAFMLLAGIGALGVASRRRRA